MRLEARKRTSGTKAARAQRREDQLPAVVYNKNLNFTVSIDRIAFDKVFRTQGLAGIINLDVEGQTHDVVVKAVQMNKRKRIAQHVDFYVVIPDQPLEIAVPVTYKGSAVGVRMGGQLDIKRREVRIRVLPDRIPEALSVDVSALNIGDVIHVSDVEAQLPEGALFADSPKYTLITIVPTRQSRSAGSQQGDGDAAEEE